MEKIKIAALKEINRHNIFKLIYQKRKIAKYDIAAKLRLSMPPVTQCLKELEQLQLIKKKEYFESSDRRKPQIISCVRKSRISIGVEVFKNQIRIVAIDIYGTIFKENKSRLIYENTSAYYQ